MSIDMETEGDPGGPVAVSPAVPESLRRIVCLSLSHATVPPDRIGTVAPEDPMALSRDIKTNERVTECVVLSTCNRVEVYGSSRTADLDDLETALSTAYTAIGEPDGVEEYVGIDAVDHLARVACGLESAILGEDQILGQVNRAFDDAMTEGLSEGTLARVADTAVRVGRKCRSETAINDGQGGYGDMICRELAENLTGPPDRVLIVGGGEMARTAAQALKQRWDARIDVANRSQATGLTSPDGRYWPLASLSDALQSVDAVVSATAAEEPVITADHVTHLPAGTPVIDLANPPDIATAARKNLDKKVLDLADLATPGNAESNSRYEAIDAVETLIDRAIERLIDRERENRAEDTLRALHRKGAAIRSQELEHVRSRLENSEADPETVLEDFASALTGCLLADPTEALRAAAREGDGETISATYRLFDLEEGNEP